MSDSSSAPDADFVYGCAINVDDRNGRQVLVLPPPFEVDYVRRFGFLCQPAVFWRRRVYEREGGFDESLRFVADCDYWMRTGERYTYVKLLEFVAIERDHGLSIREAQADRIWDELHMVQERYVTLSGLRHRLLRGRHMLRSAFWKRLQWAAFAWLSLLPHVDERLPWSRMLAHGGLVIRWHLLAVRLVPGVKSRDPILRPSREWLEPRRP